MEKLQEDFDKNKLKFMLTDAQYSSALKVVQFEKLLITTVEDRERLRKFLKK
jgi:hypothetical protein